MELKRNLFLLNNDDLLDYLLILSIEVDNCLYEHELDSDYGKELLKSFEETKLEIKSRMKREE